MHKQSTHFLILERFEILHLPDLLVPLAPPSPSVTNFDVFSVFSTYLFVPSVHSGGFEPRQRGYTDPHSSIVHCQSQFNVFRLGPPLTYFFAAKRHQICPQEQKRTPKELRASRSGKIHAQRPGRTKTVAREREPLQPLQRLHRTVCKSRFFSNYFKQIDFS